MRSFFFFLLATLAIGVARAEDGHRDRLSFSLLHSSLLGSPLLPVPSPPAKTAAAGEGREQKVAWLAAWLGERPQTTDLLVEVARRIDGDLSFPPPPPPPPPPLLLPLETSREVAASSDPAALLAADLAALEGVFRDGGGTFWTDAGALSTWMRPDVPACQWKGVYCAEEEVGGVVASRVQALMMGGFGVTEIPEPVSRLDRLRYLDLSGNKIVGAVPEFMGRLTGLQQLYLERNKIDALPESLFLLTDLEFLYLDANSIAGALSEAVGNLKALRRLYLSNNRLTSLPTSLGDLVELTTLKVHGNRIASKFPDISRLSKLVTLSISGNPFALPLPDLSRLEKLESLSLSQCNLSSLPPLPAASLKSLVMNGNRLDGDVNLCAPSLEIVYGNDNPGLQTLGPCLPSLRSVNLANTNLSSIGFLRSSPLLSDMDVSATKVGNQPLEAAKAMAWPGLQSLRADSVGVRMPVAEVLASVFPVKTLLSLDLSNNQGIGGPLDLESLREAGVLSGNLTARFSLLILRLSGTSLQRFGIGVESILPNVRMLSLRNTPAFEPMIPVNQQLWMHLKSMEITGSSPALAIPGPVPLPESPMAVDVNSSSLCPTALVGGALSSFTISADPRAYDYSLCRCMDEYYGEPSKGCIECPVVQAADVSVTIDCYSSPGKMNVTGGWFMFVKDHVTVVTCPSDTAFNPCGWNVLARTVRTLADWEAVSTQFNSSCATGFRGRLCSKCKAGFFRSGRRCYACGGRTLSWLNPLSSLLILTALGVKKVTGERSRSGLLRTLTLHAQLVALLPDMSLKVSDWSSFFIKSSGSGAGGLRLNGLECEGIAGWDGFYGPFVQAALLPVIVAVGSAWIAVASWPFVRARGAEAPPFTERFKVASLYLWLVMLFGSMQRLMAPLNCTDYGSTHGTKYLTVALWIACKGPSFRWVLGTGTLLGFGYIFFTVGLVAYRLRPSTLGTSTISVFLRSPYRPESYYWEAVQLVRRIALAFASSLTKLNSPLQPVIISSVLILSLLAHTWRKPYVRALDNAVESVSLTILLSSYMGGLIVSNPRFPSSGTSLISWLFFALNAVFLVTLTIAVLFVTAQKGLENLRRYRGGKKSGAGGDPFDDDDYDDSPISLMEMRDSKAAPLLRKK